MRKAFYLILLIFVTALCAQNLWGQSDIKPEGYTVFYHENGNKSSEGIMVNGKPDGYWKTYHESGILKSEGNRREFLLDSTWKFYDETGKLVLLINYQKGTKNGLRVSYRENEIIAENFEADVKQGLTSYYYYPDSTIYKTIIFKDGREEGLAKEFAQDGRVVTLTTYKKGYVVSRERINRIDQENRKQGLWKFFHANGLVKLEGRYSNDLKDGYFKEYDDAGKLIATTKWVGGEKQEAPVELVRLEVAKDYYPNGQLKAMQTYRNGIAQGVRRDYDEEGNIVSGSYFKEGIKVAEGITREDGLKDGPWQEFFDNGNLKAEGNYDMGVKVGAWTFYHPNGKVKQTGKYSENGKLTGRWIWYYASGNVLREESYRNGLADGLMTEYDDLGNIITEGDYIEGMREGEWLLQYGDHREIGEYAFDLRNGYWKYFDGEDNLIFEGEYIDNNPNGKHYYYWDNGNIKDEIPYSLGLKNGDWKKYDYDGVLLLVISFENGIEKKYDGVKIKPEFTEPFDQPYDEYIDE